MTFNPGSGLVADAKHLFIPDDGGNHGWSVEEHEGVLVCICTMLGEDIGMGNLLRDELLRDNQLTFVACLNPHPQEEILKLRFHLPAPRSSSNEFKLAAAKKTLADAINRMLNKLDALNHQL